MLSVPRRGGYAARTVVHSPRLCAHRYRMFRGYSRDRAHRRAPGLLDGRGTPADPDAVMPTAAGEGARATQMVDAHSLVGEVAGTTTNQTGAHHAVRLPVLLS